MAEHKTDRFEWLKAKVGTSVDSATKTFWLDVETPDVAPDITIGWSSAWDKFGVYADGHEIFPAGFEEDPPPWESLADIIAIAEEHAHEGRGDKPTKLGLVSMALLDVLIEGTRNANRERVADLGDQVAGGSSEGDPRSDDG